jgi:hypothetical protein
MADSFIREATARLVVFDAAATAWAPRPPAANAARADAALVDAAQARNLWDAILRHT